MIEKRLGHHEGHGTARRHLAAAEPDPFQLEQLVHGPAADGHAADLLDLGAGDRLVIGDDRQRLDRRAAELARLGDLPAHEKAEIGRGAHRPAIADLRERDPAPRISLPQERQRLRRIAARRHPRRHLARLQRLAGGKEHRLDHALLLGQRRDVGHEVGGPVGVLRHGAIPCGAARPARRPRTGAAPRARPSPAPAPRQRSRPWPSAAASHRG